MSQGNQLPDEQTALANLFDGLHNEIFFGKLAAAGHSHGGSPKRAQAMLELAGKLEAAEAAELQKVGADLSDPYCAANAAVDSVLAASGLDSRIKSAAAAEAERSLDETVARLCQNPVLYNSALAVKAAEATQYSNWLAQQQPASAK